MAIHQKPYFWKQMPFVRLIIPFIAGILLQTYLKISPAYLLTVGGWVCVLLLAFNFFPISLKYKTRTMAGFGLNILLAIIAAYLVRNKDITQRQDWIGNIKADSLSIVATVQEPLVEKAKTYKAEADVEAVQIKGGWQSVTGKILIYFGKDTNTIKLNYGSQVLFVKPLQEIKNSGNPGSFDYRQYNAYKDIYHQIFLKSGEYVITNTTNENRFKKWLYTTRSKVISTIRRYIEGDKEAGVAEALLIGYRNDLDKDLVQAYSNTGVVHIIAISGLHLGLIYGLLVQFMKPFRKTKWIRWVRPLIILSVLWIFTLLAGAVPSILRSAVMFSFIVIGETINRKSSTYNTLASSAFVILCINPYQLFDVGFQLSYAAVASIITFAGPIYNWFYTRNKLLDFVWKLASVTLAAQVLTTPIVFYKFHQFPLLFLITNILIVPLATIILFAALILLVASIVPAVALIIGTITGMMLHFMNFFIEAINSFPFAVYDGIQNSLVETILLYTIIISISLWLLHKSKAWLFIGLASTLGFITIDSYEKFYLKQQQKIIVYNISKMPAIDFISGVDYAFIGDTALLQNDFLQNFHLKPSRTLHNIKQKNNLENFYVSYPFAHFAGKKILLLDKPFKFTSGERISLDLIVVSHNPRLYITDLTRVFDCKQYVFDASNSSWKISQWKKDCDSLHLPNYSTADHGAFIMDVKGSE
jgi:competence protein ComEC